MNPLTKIISTALSKFNELIANLDNSTISIIRQAYFALIFILIVTAIIMGVLKGKDSARIKRPPLAPNTKDLFDRDINQNRLDGSFQKLLKDKHLKSELKGTPLNKIRQKPKDRLMPEFDDSVLDSKRSISTRRLPAMKVDDRPIDGNYRTKRKESDVSLLKKKKAEKKIDKTSTPVTTKKSRIIRSKKNTTTPKQIFNDNKVLDN